MGSTDFTISTENKIIFSSFSGSLRYSDILMHIEAVTTHPNFSNEYNSLAVLSENTTFNFLSDGDNEKLSGMISQYTKVRPGSKWALVTPSHLKDKITKAVNSFGESSLQFGIFDSEDDALTWLQG